jgi:hypothetical protein
MFNDNDKQRMIDEITEVIKRHQINQPHIYDTGGVIDERIKALAKTIAEEIGKQIAIKVVEELIARIYTHEQFEEDLGLI